MLVIKKHITILRRFISILFYYFIMNILMILNDVPIYYQHWGLVQFIILGITLLILSRKSERIIDKVEFNDLKKELIISYFRLGFFHLSHTTAYSDLGYRYKLKRFGYIDFQKSLVFLTSNKFIAEIKEKNSTGWTTIELEEMIRKINSIKDEISNKT